MHIGNIRLWLGLGVAGMVAAIVVLFGVGLSNTPEAEATSGDGFDRIEIQVAKSDPAFLKVSSAFFTCNTPTQGPVIGKFEKHLDNVNPNDPPDIHHEVWSGTFPNKCTGTVSITLTRFTGSDPLVIKGCVLENKTSGKKALCETEALGGDMFTATETFSGSKFNRIVVEVGKDDKFFKVDKGNPLNTFTCQSTDGTPETVPAVYKDHQKNVNDPLPHLEVWSGTFTKICEVTDNAGGSGVAISLVPVNPTNTLVIKACHLQFESDNGGAQKKATCDAKVQPPAGAAQIWKAF